MSGLEIFGLAASAASFVSLGIQLGESVMKLRKICHAIKDAPERTQSLVFALETMDMGLRQLEEHRQMQAGRGGPLLDRCIMQCEQCVNEIQQLVDKLENRLSKHSRSGKAYVMFKESDIKEQLDRLEKARSTLEFACMLYLGGEQRKREQAREEILFQHRSLLQGLQSQVAEVQAQVREGNTFVSKQMVLLAKLPDSSQQISAPPNKIQLPSAEDHETRALERADSDIGEENQLGSTLPQARPPKRKNSKTYARLQFRVWFSQCVWDLAVTNSLNRWSMDLRSCNLILDDNSPIIKYCRAGDVLNVRRLIEGGKATPLDINTNGRTLLYHAAVEGNIEVCRYLLQQTTWPDHSRELSYSLGRFALYNKDIRFWESKWATQMYRLFVESSEFDADTENNDNPLWLIHCPSDCVEIILQNQSRFEAFSAEKRFELVSRVFSMRISHFLRCIGLQAEDPNLALLRNTMGHSVLHYVARHISQLINTSNRDELQEWMCLGVKILQNGGDPCGIASYDRYVPWKVTPLLECMGLQYNFLRNDRVTQTRTLKALHLWLDLVQQGGFELSEYGARESRVWESLGIGIDGHAGFHYIPSSTKVVGLIYGSEVTHWTLNLCIISRIAIYTLESLPGSFVEESQLPRKISWLPAEKEENEGLWKELERYYLVSNILDLKELATLPVEPFRQLMEGTQDDLGPIFLALCPNSKRPKISPRSHSQPPYLRRTKATHSRSDGIGSRFWLPDYHRCPVDFHWRFDCGPHNGGYLDQSDVSGARGCFNISAQGSTMVQESIEWKRGSFLANIAQCQDATYNSHEELINRPWLPLGHTGTRDCPHGCTKVHLDQLKVPERLRPFHPHRMYPDGGEIHGRIVDNDEDIN